MISFSIIREWINFAANICILFITLYTFYLTFISKKIQLTSIAKSSSNTDGESFSVILENRSLSPSVIESIYIIIDNKYKLQMKKFESPLILEAFTAKKITSEGYSYTIPDIPSFSSRNIILEVNTSRKKLYLRMRKSNLRVSKDMRSIPHNVTKFTPTYNGKIIPKNAKFVLIVNAEKRQKTIFIFKTGLMTEEVLGYNAIPEESVEDQLSLIHFLDSWLKPNGIKYNIAKLDNYFIECSGEVPK